MTNFPKYSFKLAVAACALSLAFTLPAAAQYLQLPGEYQQPSAMVDNSVNAPTGRPAADSTPLVDNSVDNSVRTVPPGLKNPSQPVPPPMNSMEPAVDMSPEKNMAPSGPAGDYQTVSGGISEEGRDGFLAAHAGEGYNAKMLFTGPAGNMLADVDVGIKNAKGEEVVRTKTDGPLLLAKLPRGTYKVQASYKGEMKNASLAVGKSRMASSVFRFKNGD